MKWATGVSVDFFKAGRWRLKCCRKQLKTVPPRLAPSGPMSKHFSSKLSITARKDLFPCNFTYGLTSGFNKALCRGMALLSFQKDGSFSQTLYRVDMAIQVGGSGEGQLFGLKI